jgi:hypothetical protein
LIDVEEAVMSEPEIPIPILREILFEIAALRSEMVTKNDITTLRGELGKEIGGLFSEVQSLRTDIAFGLMSLESRLGVSIIHLSQTVTEYHSTTVGNCVRIRKFQERLHLVEQKLKLPPHEAH